MEYKLRDYKHSNQIGLSGHHSIYLHDLDTVFTECKRILKKDGTCWIVIADSHNDNKCLQLIPERFAIKMTDRGWILRNKIIWKKLNVFPQSAKDRFTIDYEYIYFFTKSQKYYFKTQYEPLSIESIKRDQRGRTHKSKTHNSPYSQGLHKAKLNNKYIIKTTIKFGGNKAKGYGNTTYSGKTWNYDPEVGRIKRSIWIVNTKGTNEEHYAAYPENLVFQCMKAGCKPNGIILDPFMGTGTTAVVALKNNRKFIGIEVSEFYKNMALKRINPYLEQTKLEVFIKQ